MPDLGSLLTVALRAADTAAGMIQARYPESVIEKHDRDLVSDVDIAIEKEVRQQLAKATPSIGFLGEEEGRTGDPASGWLWILDPIDGTSNFAHGMPLCAVSLALLRGSRAVVAVVDAPFLGQRFHATKGRGAFKGNERLSASNVGQLRDAVVAVGDYATGPQADRKNELQLALTAQLAPRVHRMRMLGTAALDLAWVAAGYLDGSIILDNKPWDTAAGALIAQEAGAHVTDSSGIPHSLNSTFTIAAGPSLIDKLISLLHVADSSDAGRR
jgi:myo-inositol-1(or 4)-monophosphatase